MALSALLPLVIVMLSGCAPAATLSPMPSPSDAGRPLRYVAIGDSYTIGTSVDEADRWPNLLVDALRPAGGGEPPLALVANLAVNGWTSANVYERQVPNLMALDPEFVSLLVGVNDVVQGVPAETFERNATLTLDALLARLPAERIVVVSTPDYTVTPQGASYGDPAQQRAGIVVNNAILRTLADARGVAFVEIFDISGRAESDRTMVARDGLHPSGAQYALWVERIAPVVSALLR